DPNKEGVAVKTTTQEHHRKVKIPAGTTGEFKLPLKNFRNPGYNIEIRMIETSKRTNATLDLWDYRCDDVQAVWLTDNSRPVTEKLYVHKTGEPTHYALNYRMYPHGASDLA